MNNIELVETETHLAKVIDRALGAPRVAVDIESNGFFRYMERVCLVQLAVAETAYLVDTVAIKDVQPLGSLLRDRSVEKIFHAAQNDIPSLHRDWGFRVVNVFDTQIAAKFVGEERDGLESVAKKFAGVDLAKPRKIQRSDWSKRPLSPRALEYAANDVLHLSKVRDSLSSRLHGLSRFEWVKEEFARLEGIEHTPKDQRLTFLSIKGSQKLDGRGLAILRSLAEFREREARRIDRPLFMVMQNSVLVEIASAPESDLSRVKGIGRYARNPGIRRLKSAIRKGQRSKPVERPPRKRSELPRSRDERERADARYETLRRWRNQLGQDLGLSPGLLWPKASLTRLAWNPGDLQSEFARPEVRDWQEREFGSALSKVLESLH